MRSVGCSGILVASLVVTPAVALGQVFTYTGAEQVYGVPTGVTQVHVIVVGAPGGGAVGAGGETVGGGLGSVVSANLPIPAGQSALYVEIGGIGARFNGGGAPNGGDASDVRLLARAIGLDRLEVDRRRRGRGSRVVLWR